MNRNKIIRITTVPASLSKLLEGQLAFMNQYYKIIAISSKGSILESLAKTENIRVHPIDMTRKITPFKDLVSLIQMYCFFKKEQPQIVHTHTPKAGTLGMIAAKLAGVKIRMHTVAGLPLLEKKGFKRKILNLVEKITYCCATNIYPNSFGLMNIIKEKKICNSNKLKVIANGSSNGIDLEYFNPDLFTLESISQLKSDLNITPDDFVFLYIGRIVSDKGINELIDAFDMISQKDKNIKLILVGREESNLDPISSKSSVKINSNINIIRVGYQKDVRPYLNISNVLVFPSYREGFPNTVIQACAMMLPAIVTDINGCNEIVINNHNGIVIPVKDRKALYLAMVKVIKEKEVTLKNFSKNSRNMIKKYNRKVVWEALLLEYKTLEKKVYT